MLINYFCGNVFIRDIKNGVVLKLHELEGVYTMSCCPLGRQLQESHVCGELNQSATSESNIQVCVHMCCQCLCVLVLGSVLCVNAFINIGQYMCFRNIGVCINMYTFSDSI